MRDPERSRECRNCGRELPARRLDRQQWCDSCRRVVIQRASRLARVAGLLAAVALFAWVAFGIVPTRFLVIWVVLVVATYFFVYKLVQRVAFEIIRARGVPPAEE